MKNSKLNINSKGKNKGEINNCIPADIPIEGNDNRITPGVAVMYYNVLDNCNFQTLSLDAYGLATSIPTVILGRFKTEKISHKELKINRIEAKAFSLKAKYGKKYVDENGMKVQDEGVIVKKLELIKSSSKKNAMFKVYIETTKNNNRKKNIVDYTYGNLPNETHIKINKDAKMSFLIVRGPNEKPTGGYECDGKVVISGG